MSGKPVFSGIVCELNPLHRGHAYLLQEARRHSDAVVCVMSGNWVQRGEPAVLSKFVRARMALACGADLVAELPLPWACAGAEPFAFGAVSLLDSLGCIGQLWFGSECGDAERLNRLASLLLSPAFSNALRDCLQTGKSFAAARQQAVTQLAGSEEAALLESANNILGIEYCKALHRLQSPITPMTVKRMGSPHDCRQEATPDAFLSASQLRELLREGQSLEGLLPPAAWQILQEEISAGRAPGDFSRLETAVIARLRSMSKAEFAALPDVSEGLENRLYEVSRRALTLEALYEGVKSKRYSHARIRRIVAAAFLGIPRNLPAKPPYFRVLAMNARGREVLRAASQKATIPLLSRPRDFLQGPEEPRSLFALEQRATDLFALTLPAPPACGWDCRQGVLALSSVDPAENGEAERVSKENR